MSGFLSRMARAPRMLWIDADAYAGRLLAHDAVPWTDAAALVAWHRQAMALVKGDVAVLRVAPVAAAWFAADAGLRETMRERRRPLSPLRQLLACEPLRGHLAEVLAGLRFNSAGVPLALVLPSPRDWLVQAFQTAHGELPQIDADDVEAAATYIADFLRSFASVGIDVLMLELPDDEELASASAAEVWQPLRNLASHYAWAMGLRLANAAATAPSTLDFAIASTPLPGLKTGLWLSPADWESGKRIDATAAFVYCQVPPRLRPEAVLERIAGWR